MSMSGVDAKETLALRPDYDLLCVPILNVVINLLISHFVNIYNKK
jgi:hypothetical protein